MGNFFTSDLHVGHKRIMEYCPRSRAIAGGDMDSMKQLILDGINGKVTREDDLYILGDLSFTTRVREVEEFLMAINARQLHLVVGNHDQITTGSRKLLNYFDSVSHYKEIKIGDDRIIMMHYPIESWNHMNHGAYHLHGHTHSRNDKSNTDEHRGKLQYFARRFDVGVDSRYDLSPWSWEEIKEYVANRETSINFRHVMDQGV